MALKVAVSQIYEVVNSLAKQAFGSEAPVAVDATSWVSLGNFVLNSNDHVDAFYGVLTDRIGRVKAGARRYSRRTRRMMRDAMTWGVIMQKLYAKDIDASENAVWDTTVQVSPYDIEKKTELVQKLFRGFGTYTFEDMLPTVQLKTGFTNPETMAAVIGMIDVQRGNKYEEALEDLENTAIAVNIAGIMEKGTPAQKLYLRTLYKNATGNTTTGAGDADYYRFITTIISKTIKKMARQNKVYNAEGFLRHTPSEDLVVELNLDFTADFNAYLQSDTFHNELTALPNYDEVDKWQTLQAPLTIKVQHDELKSETNESGEVTVENVIGFIHDIESCGTTIFDEYSWSLFNPRQRVQNYGDYADLGFFVDLSEQGVVLIDAEDPTAE